MTLSQARALMAQARAAGGARRTKRSRYPDQRPAPGGPAAAVCIAAGAGPQASTAFIRALQPLPKVRQVESPDMKARRSAHNRPSMSVASASRAAAIVAGPMRPSSATPRALQGARRPRHARVHREIEQRVIDARRKLVRRERVPVQGPVDRHRLGDRQPAHLGLCHRPAAMLSEARGVSRASSRRRGRPGARHSRPRRQGPG